MRAVGVHVFAGGFTMGVKRVMEVECQLEAHGFGLESAEKSVGVPTVNREDAKWPRMSGQLCFGNPRCTGFSCVTAGLDETSHGPWSRQTVDARQLVEYAAGHFDVIVWESVQQAYTVGKPLLDHMIKEWLAPNHYRIAHLFINAASFGNVQNRKRYFMVAYRDDRPFNVVPPVISPYYPVAYDVLWSRRDRVTRPMKLRVSEDYDADCYTQLNEDEIAAVPYLPNGWSLNTLARYGTHLLTERHQRKWRERQSGMPFSMHCPYRANYLRHFPTLTSSAGRTIHPEHDRACTVGELSAVMGWGDTIPRGPHPVAQLAKGVVPAVGEWLAEQVKRYVDGHWPRDEDWESTFDSSRGEWIGGDASGKLEKTIDLTRYVGQDFDRERYDVTDEVLFRHRLHVDGRVRERAGERHGP